MRWSVLLVLLGAVAIKGADLPVFNDTVENGWENWSWAETSNSSNPIHSGTSSFAVTAGAWEAAYFHNSTIDPTLYTNLIFWIHGGSAGGQKLLITGIASTAARTSVDIPTLAANTWQQVTVSLEALGVAGDPGFDGFWIQDRSGITQPTFYLDDIKLVAGSGATNPPTNAVVQIAVNVALNRHPISDLIYGVAFASSNQLEALNSPLNRSGGNSESRYNWQLNAHNRGFDWYFESLADASSAPGAETDDFIRESINGSAEPMVTIPMIGWVAKLGPSRGKLASFSISKYGAQTDADWQWFPDAGNGIRSNGQYITNNDPNDANVLVDSTFQQQWVRHLTNQWSASGNGGVRYYIMDNEPSLWHSSHRDVFKTGLTMEELRDRFIDHARKVRAVDPGALIVGPEEWGWSGYFYSGYDQQWSSSHGWTEFPDRQAHGNQDYLPWLLDQLRQQRDATGESLLDVFTVHYYPQGGEYGSDVSTAMQTKRNRSTRSLWDTNYVDASWISDKVKLIPRLKKWVEDYYPGAKVGLTEYSWGADAHINGATAQADLLGIFGREGLDMATRWVVPGSTTPTFKAFQMYRNYDGAKSTFGDTSVLCTVPNPDNVAAFAAERSSDGALTIMAINKTGLITPVEISMDGFSHAGNAKRWQLTSENITRDLGTLNFSGNVVTQSLPAQSITLFVFPAIQEARFQGVFYENGVVNLEIAGKAGAALNLESSNDLKSWLLVKPIMLNSTNQTEQISGTNRARFYRLVKP